MNGGYIPALQGYDARKYSSQTAPHLYNVVSAGSPPPDSMGLNGHPSLQYVFPLPTPHTHVGLPRRSLFSRSVLLRSIRADRAQTVSS